MLLEINKIKFDYMPEHYFFTILLLLALIKSGCR